MCKWSHPLLFCYILASMNGDFSKTLAQNVSRHPSHSIYNVAESCGVKISLDPSGRSSGGLLQLWQGVDMEPLCSVRLFAPESYQILIAFEAMDSGNVIHENVQNYLRVYINAFKEAYPGEEKWNRTLSSKPGERISISASQEQSSKSNKTLFSFLLSFTTYNNSVGGECHGPERFRCKNDRCVWLHFRCNGYDNCGDKSDEMGCNSQALEGTKMTILRTADSMLIFLSLSLVILILLFTILIVLVLRRPRNEGSPRSSNSVNPSVSTITLNCEFDQYGSAQAFYNDGISNEDEPPSYEEVMIERNRRTPLGRSCLQDSVPEMRSPPIFP